MGQGEWVVTLLDSTGVPAYAEATRGYRRPFQGPTRIHPPSMAAGCDTESPEASGARSREDRSAVSPGPER